MNQNVSESNTSIVINNQQHVSWSYASSDLTLTIEKYSERYILPAMIAIANQVDYDLTGLATDVPSVVGTGGTAVTSFATSVQLVGQRMDEQAVPRAQRILVLDPRNYWALAAAIVGGGTSMSLFNEKIVESAFARAKLTDIGNFAIYQDQNIRTLTRGTNIVGHTTVTTASQVGSSIACVATTAETYKKGEMFTFAGAYAINPKSLAAYNYLKNFVLTADATASGSAVTLSIYPSIITSGAYATCSASPTGSTSAATPFTAAGTNWAQCMGFIKQAFALVMVPLEMPDGAPFKARESHNNLSIRVIKDYDIDNDLDIIRLDVLYGTKTIYPELAVTLGA